MAATVPKELAKAKLKARKKKQSGLRTVPLGDPEIVQLKLKIDKATSEIVNLPELIEDIDQMEVDELKELSRSLFGKPTRLRDKQKLVDGVLGFLARVQEQYEGAAAPKPASKKEKPDKKAKAKPRPTTEVKDGEPEPPAVDTGYKVGQSWPKRYKGMNFELVVVEGGFRLDGPPGHPAVGKVYGAPTPAAKAVTGYKSQDGVRWFGMKTDSPVGRNAPCAKRMKPRDPRLPMPGETILKYYNDKRYAICFRDDHTVEVLDTTDNEKASKSIGIYDSISAAASAISDCQENGYRFFNLDHKVDTLDPWRALVALLDAKFPGEEKLTTEKLVEVIDKVLAIAEEANLDFQDEADAIARAFYKRRAIEKYEAMEKVDA
jgi:hypothetical protein